MDKDLQELDLFFAALPNGIQSLFGYSTSSDIIKSIWNRIKKRITEKAEIVIDINDGEIEDIYSIGAPNIDRVIICADSEGADCEELITHADCGIDNEFGVEAYITQKPIDPLEDDHDIMQLIKVWKEANREF